ncbi:MAG TPA: potassium-transporting ATPase subunit C [Micromonosporaceae bacterium]|jgi:K+-transporting ATPase ATPase C chain
MRIPSWITQHIAALRALLVLTVILGIVYPLVLTGVAQIPGLRSKADGSLVKVGDSTVGSSLIGQSFTDAKGNPLVQYFQSRPSDAGDGYDPTATSASNLGPESVVDTLPDPSVKGDTGTQALLSQVCSRSLAVGRLEGVSGARPYCTADGLGAVLVVVRAGGVPGGNVTAVYSVNQACPATPFLSTYDGVAVQCAKFGTDYTALGTVTPIRGSAPARPAVPSDAVTASGSGLDPDISVAYAHLQAPRVARERNTTVANVDSLIDTYTTGRALGFMGDPAVNVLQLNMALDRRYPYRP